MTDSDIVGTYITNNPEKISIGEIPTEKDTLILKTDKTFISGYYGEGKYEIEKNIFTTTIRLKYQYEFGKASFRSDFENKLFGTTKIILNDDLDIAYHKVNW